MRYLFAALTAAFIITVDFSQDGSHRPIWAESFIGVADAQVTPSESEDSRQKADSEEHATPVTDEASREGITSPFLANEAVPVSVERVCEAIKDAAEASGIPVGFFARLLWQESKFRSEEISSAGAKGIAQFMPMTALEVGLNDPLDPLQAIPASARFLRKLHNQFGNLGLAAAAYNAGGGRIEKWLSRRGPLPQETRAYVQIITGNKAEDWTNESRMISVPTDLPRQAPCDGVDGLSKSKRNQVADVLVTLTPSVSEMVRKAEADDAQAKLNAARIASKQLAMARARMLSHTLRRRSADTKIAARLVRKPLVRMASASSR